MDAVKRMLRVARYSLFALALAPFAIGCEEEEEVYPGEVFVEEGPGGSAVEPMPASPTPREEPAATTEAETDELREQR